MNKKLMMLLFLIITSICTFAQKESIKNRLAKVNNDTMQYVKTYIVSQKELYVQNPLDSLLSNLPTTVKRYVLLTSDKPGFYKGVYLILNKVNQSMLLERDKKEIYVTVEFATTISREEIKRAGIQKLQGSWDEPAKKIFEKLTVSDVGLVEN